MCKCIYGPHHSCVNGWDKDFALSMAECFGRVGRGRGRGRGRSRGKKRAMQELESETSSDSSNEEIKDGGWAQVYLTRRE